jgi:hypothetical protein
MIQAVGIVRGPLEAFYNSLSDEQKQRLAQLGPASDSKRGPASDTDLASMCGRRVENFTRLPVERIEQTVKPTQQQQEALEKLKLVSTQAADQLQATCPSQMPQTVTGRLDAIGRRLDAMAGAVKLVRPALTNFYDLLSDEQKARFNILGPPRTSALNR